MPVHRFYTTESISPNSKRAWTPEGFLLCQSVPIARVGVLLYGRGEIPVAPNADGLIRIMRDPAEVFHSNAVLSFAGKPLTDEHPPTRVTPDNWKQHSIGTVLNPHQGDGRTENNDLLYADLLVQDRQAIDDVLAGKREVSAGYDAEYEQIKPGEGKQHNIIGNHVALVSRGRCGPICAIGDSAMAKVRLNPKQRRAQTRDAMLALSRDAIMKAFMTGDEEGLVDELDKVEEMLGSTAEGSPSEIGAVGFHKSGGGSASSADDMSGTHVHIHTGGAMDDVPPKSPEAAASPGAPPAPAGAPPPGAAPGGGVTLEQLSARVDQLEQAIAILAQGEEPEPEVPDEASPGMSGTPPTGDRQRTAMVGDSAALTLIFQEVLSRAELLNPGQRRPTFDAAQPVKVTTQSMCDYRRMTIDNALKAGGEARDAIVTIAGSPTKPDQAIKSMSCDAVAVVFNGASEMIRTKGLRGRTTQDGVNYGNSGQSVQTAGDVVARINEMNQQRYHNAKTNPAGR